MQPNSLNPGRPPASSLYEYVTTHMAWVTRIQDFKALKRHVQTRTVFVSLDVKLCSGGHINEIGIASLPSIGDQKPVDIEDFTETHNVVSYRLKMRNQGYRPPKGRGEESKWRFQEPIIEEIGIDLAESKMVEFLEYIRKATHVEHITLVSPSLGTFEPIIHQAPAVVQYISAWVDMQSIIRDMNRPAGILGNRGYQATDLKTCEDNGAVGTLAQFTGLAQISPSGYGLRLEMLLGNPYIERRECNILKDMRFIVRNYPFRAIVRMRDCRCLCPEILHPLMFQEYFSEYSIDAIGHDWRGVGTHSKYISSYYCVCLNSAEELAYFVRDNDQRALKCGRKLHVFKVNTNRFKPGDKQAVASTRKKDKEDSDKDRENDLVLGLASRMKRMLI